MRGTVLQWVAEAAEVGSVLKRKAKFRGTENDGRPAVRGRRSGRKRPPTVWEAAGVEVPPRTWRQKTAQAGKSALEHPTVRALVVRG